MTKNGTILSLQDLQPKETTFTLGDFGGQKFTLSRWSLRVRVWATEKYGPAKLKEIFEKQNIIAIADIAWFMLKEKNLFNDSQDEFFDKISGVQDEVNLVTALLGAVGIGEPEIKKIREAMEKEKAPEAETENPDPNVSSPAKTGAESLTP